MVSQINSCRAEGRLSVTYVAPMIANAAFLRGSLQFHRAPALPTRIWKRSPFAAGAANEPLADEAHNLGYIGRCGDVSMYIMREFARRFADDREMRALALVELSIDNGEYIPVVGWNHVAPIVVPSIVFKSPDRIGVLYNAATGEISPVVTASAFVLDA